MARRGRDRAELVVISWRDIPAQVNVQVGRDRHQVVLGAKFQRAIDRAKRKAGIVTAEEDVAQWQRRASPLSGDPETVAAAEARRLTDAFTRDRLGRLAFVGGWEADVDPAAPVDPAELAALEEIEPAEGLEPATAETQEDNP